MLLNALMQVAPSSIFKKPESSIVLATDTLPTSPKIQPEQPPKWQQLTNRSKPIALSVAVGAEGLPHALVKKALIAWETGTQKWVQFQLLENPCSKTIETADILLLWAKNMGLPHQENHPSAHNTGKAWLHVKSINSLPIIVGSTIELVQFPLIDSYLSYSQQTNRLYTTILHEIGHALGLSHGKNTGSVMHCSGWKNTQLTVEDIGLVTQLYGNPF